MNSFHETLLARYDYLLRDVGEEKSKVIEYHKTILSGGLEISSYIEVYYHENPDNLAYRGIVSFIREDGRRIAEWDTDRRYKLFDVIIGCEKVLAMAEGLRKHYTGENK